MIISAEHRGNSFAWLHWVLLGLLAPVAAFLFVALASGGGLYVGAAAGIVLLTWAAWRWPTSAAIAFMALTPVNRFLIMLLYHYTGSVELTRAAQLWKDFLLIVLFFRVGYLALFIAKHRIRYLDWLIVSFLGLSFIYIFFPGPLNVDQFQRLQGFRSDSMFMFAYFVGLGLPLARRHLALLLLAFVPGSLAVAAVAAWQFVDTSHANQVFDSLGWSQYGRLHNIVGDALAVRERDLGGGSLPRASSLLLGDLALAFYQVVMVAVSAAIFFTAKRARDQLLAGAFLAMMLVTLTLTLSRSAMLAAAVVIVAMAAYTRSAIRLTAALAICFTVLLVTLVVNPTAISSVLSLSTVDDPSARQHAAAFQASLTLVTEQPLGIGLGTAGTVAQRYSAQGTAITNENWYLQLATEMGVAGAALYVAIVLLIMLMAIRNHALVKDFWLRVITLAVAGSALGFIVLGNFLHAWENTILSMSFWFLAGVAARAPELGGEAGAEPPT
jgi:hypothetical protein